MYHIYIISSITQKSFVLELKSSYNLSLHVKLGKKIIIFYQPILNIYIIFVIYIRSIIMSIISCVLHVAAPAEQLWDGVSSVSNAGRKKGRGRAVGRKKITDLNRGQRLGDGGFV
jgi:hypothetical protein